MKASAGNARARHSSRNEPRASAWRSMAPYSTPGSADGGRVGLMPGSRPRAAGPARSRPSRRARPAAARPTEAASARGRPSAAAGTVAARWTAGTLTTSTSTPARADDVARPVGARGEQAVDEVVDPGQRVGRQQVDDRLGDIGRVGRGAPLVADRAERLAGRPRAFGGVEDPAREVAPGRPEQPGRAGDPEAGPGPSGEGGRGQPLGLGLGRAVRVARRQRLGRLVRATVDPAAVEDLVGGHDQQLGPARGAGLGQDAGRGRVATHRQLRVERAAVDVGPGGGMDDDLGPVPVEQRPDRAGCIEVERLARPADRPGRTGERGVGEGRDEVAAEATGRTGDGDPHQSPGVAAAPASAVVAAAAWPVASRWPYWRSYQPSQSPDRAARHHASLARYQSTVAARPSSNAVAGRQPSAASSAAVHRVAAIVPGPVLDLHDQRPRLAELLEQERHDLAVRPLRRAGDVVRLARLAVAQHEVDRGGVVADVQPLAPLEAVAVQRQRPVVERVGHEQRDELLGMVVRPVRVRAAGHDRVDAVGHDVGAARAARRPPWPPRTGSAGRAARPRSRGPRRPSRRPRRSRPAGSAAGRAPRGTPRAGRGRR